MRSNYSSVFSHIKQLACRVTLPLTCPELCHWPSKSPSSESLKDSPGSLSLLGSTQRSEKREGEFPWSEQDKQSTQGSAKSSVAAQPASDTIADEEEDSDYEDSSDYHTISNGREREKGKEKKATQSQEESTSGRERRGSERERGKGIASGSHEASRWNSCSVCRAAQWQSPGLVDESSGSYLGSCSLC
jgi:hypothetical protein